MDKFQRGVGRDIFFDIFKHPHRNLFINFDWRFEISNEFVKMKVGLIPQLFLVQSFLEKDNLLCPNEV